MRLRTAAYAVVALAISVEGARAHDFVAGAGILNGILHPLLVPAQALCLLAFGLMTGQQQDETGRIVLIMSFFLAALAAIALVVLAVFPFDLVPALLLACGAAAGLLTALARPLPRAVPAAVLVGGAMALIIDSVPSVISRRDTILALAGTLVAATSTLGLVAYGVATLKRDWQRIGIRVAGSWTAASALLVLALRLVK